MHGSFLFQNLLYFCGSQPQTEQCRYTVSVLDESQEVWPFSTVSFYRKCQTWPYNKKDCTWLLVASHTVYLTWIFFFFDQQVSAFCPLIKSGITMNLFWIGCYAQGCRFHFNIGWSTSFSVFRHQVTIQNIMKYKAAQLSDKMLLWEGGS